LTETDGVLARGHAVEAFEVRLVDASVWEVQIDSVCWGR
jgi:hypothetical protein